MSKKVKGALLVVVFAAAVLVVVAVVDWSLVESTKDCPLGLEFERISSELIEHRRFPPLAVCRYYFIDSDGQQLYPPEDIVRDAHLTTVLGGVGVLLSR